MNEAALVGLKTMVERAVRPVVAPRDRKRAMREELLAHVTAVFDEERDTLSDDAAALERARQRFGNPRDLTADLQRSVSRWGRALAGFQRWNWGYWNPGESVARMAAKQGGMLLAVAALLFVLVLGIEISKGDRGEVGVTFRIALVDVMVVALFPAAFLVLQSRRARGLFGSRHERSWATVLAFGAASLAAFPLMAFGAYWLATGDLRGSLEYLLFACVFAPLGPFILYAGGRMAYRQMCYEQEWASLEVDE